MLSSLCFPLVESKVYAPALLQHGIMYGTVCMVSMYAHVYEEVAIRHVFITLENIDD